MPSIVLDSGIFGGPGRPVSRESLRVAGAVASQRFADFLDSELNVFRDRLVQEQQKLCRSLAPAAGGWRGSLDSRGSQVEESPRSMGSFDRSHYRTLTKESERAATSEDLTLVSSIDDTLHETGSNASGASGSRSNESPTSRPSSRAPPQAAAWESGASSPTKKSKHMRASFEELQPSPSLRSVLFDDASKGMARSNSGTFGHRKSLASRQYTSGDLGAEQQGTSEFEVLAAWGEEQAEQQTRLTRLKSFQQCTPLEMEEVHDDEDDADETPWLLQRFVRHPSSSSRIAWDLVGLVLIAYDCIMVPMEVFSPEDTHAIIAIQWMIRLFWTFNMPMSCFVGHMKPDGTVAMRLPVIVRRYCMTWLPLDIVVVGFHWAELFLQNTKTGGINRIGTSLRAVRMMRTVRLFRMLKAPEIADKILALIPLSEQLGLLAEIGRIMIVFLWMAHVVACTFYGLSLLVRDRCPECSTWIDIEGTDQMSLAQKYCLSFHWSLSVLAGESGLVTIGNLTERCFTIFCLFLAFVVSAFYVGSITTSMTRLQLIASEQSSKLSALRRFMLENKISRPLAVRVQRNAQFVMLEEKSKAPESSVELLRAISQPVLVEVHFEINSRVLFTHPFIATYHEQVNPTGIKKVCHSAVNVVSLSNKDVLFSELEVPETPAMYFLMSGKVMYFQQGHPAPKFLQPGSCLVEAALWTKWTHAGTLRATMETRFLALDAAQFASILGSWPTVHARWYAQEFVLWLNEQTEKSDLGPDSDELEELVEMAFNDGSEAESEETDFIDDDEDDHGEGGDAFQEDCTVARQSSRKSNARSAGPGRSPSILSKGGSFVGWGSDLPGRTSRMSIMSILKQQPAAPASKRPSRRSRASVDHGRGVSQVMGDEPSNVRTTRNGSRNSRVRRPKVVVQTWSESLFGLFRRRPGPASPRGTSTRSSKESAKSSREAPVVTPVLPVAPTALVPRLPTVSFLNTPSEGS